MKKLSVSSTRGLYWLEHCVDLSHTDCVRKRLITDKGSLINGILSNYLAPLIVSKPPSNLYPEFTASNPSIDRAKEILAQRVLNNTLDELIDNYSGEEGIDILKASLSILPAVSFFIYESCEEAGSNLQSLFPVTASKAFNSVKKNDGEWEIQIRENDNELLHIILDAASNSSLK